MFLDLHGEDVHKSLAEMRDEEVLELAKSKPDVFGELVERYESLFVRKARGVVRTQQDAEDVVQEVFVKIYMHADKFAVQEGASFKSWAFKILFNTCFTRYQKLKKHKEQVSNIDPEFEELVRDKRDTHGEYTTREYIISVFARMPESFSTVLRRYFIEGTSQKELAEEEGVSVSAIKTRIHRAKKSFQEAHEDVK
jgi:RNA polymerase sigma-70 factor (ECF subfamily)